MGGWVQGVLEYLDGLAESHARRLLVVFARVAAAANKGAVSRLSDDLHILIRKYLAAPSERHKVPPPASHFSARTHATHIHTSSSSSSSSSSPSTTCPPTASVSSACNMGLAAGHPGLAGGAARAAGRWGGLACAAGQSPPLVPELFGPRVLLSRLSAPLVSPTSPPD